MCTAQDFSEQLLSIYNNINQEVRRLCSEVQTADYYDMDMLHIIENTKFNACDGYKLAKLIQENRLFRRQIKIELETMKQLKNNFVDKNMELLSKTQQEIVRRNNILTNQFENKIYIPRVIGKEAGEPYFTHQSTTHGKNENQPTTTPIKAIHRKTKEELQIMCKVDDYHFAIKRASGELQVMRKENIINMEFSQVAK